MGEKNVKKNLLASEVKPKTTKYYMYLFCTIFPYFWPLMLGHHTRELVDLETEKENKKFLLLALFWIWRC